MTEFSSINQKQKETKETVFEHYMHKSQWKKSTRTPNTFIKVVWIGYSEFYEKDLFAAYERNNSIVIYTGIKGNEFD